MKSSFFSNNQVKLNEIDSTNKFLLQLHKKKKFTNTVVVTTDFQTNGKGRKGNSWESERFRSSMGVTDRADSQKMHLEWAS